MDSSPIFTELVEYIVKSIVDNPDDVNITEYEDRNSVVVEVRVAQSDMGRVIGRGGRVVNSIRALVQVLATKKGRRVSLEIIESGE